MPFKKLFRLLVVSGAMSGATVASGCAAQAQQNPTGKSASGSADAGMAADAGAKQSDSGGGAQGW
jgi:hypothetical protein